MRNTTIWLLEKLPEPNLLHAIKPSTKIISRKYSIQGYPFEIRLVWGNAICFAILHRNEHLLKLIVFSYMKDFDHQTKHDFINQGNVTKLAFTDVNASPST